MANVRGLGDYRGGGSGSGGGGGNRSAGNVRGLGDYGGPADDDSDDDRNELYTGGEKSGMVVKGPPKDKKAAVEGIFESAKQHGAAQGTAEDLARAKGDQQPSGGVSAFTGAVRTLDGRNDSVGPPPGQQQRPGPSAHTITFYSNGVFTVDEGAPRGITDPENQDFMQSISKGECPAELEPEDRNTPVEVNLVRVEHDYQPPAEPRFNSFQGTGRKLTADAGASASSSAAQAAPAGEWGGIDESQPSTSLQIRLADGSRMVAKFNLTHTVGDIRRFIRAARPDITGPYQLMTAFPSQPLSDESATIEGAGLKNAVVIQKQ